MNSTCRCGAAPTDTGQCSHCDRLGDAPCTATCPRCVRRDEHCVCCGRDCGTKAAAQSCERHERGVESQQRA